MVDVALKNCPICKAYMNSKTSIDKQEDQNIYYLDIWYSCVKPDHSVTLRRKKQIDIVQ